LLFPYAVLKRSQGTDTSCADNLNSVINPFRKEVWTIGFDLIKRKKFRRKRMTPKKMRIKIAHPCPHPIEIMGKQRIATYTIRIGTREIGTVQRDTNTIGHAG
jgi:hypothetical protein